MPTIREEFEDLAEQIGRFAQMREQSPLYAASPQYRSTARTYRRVQAWMEMILADHPRSPVETIRPTVLHRRQGTDRIDQGAP